MGPLPPILLGKPGNAELFTNISFVKKTFIIFWWCSTYFDYLVTDLRSSQAHKHSVVPVAFYLVVEVEQGKQTLDANIFSVQL